MRNINALVLVLLFYGLPSVFALTPSNEEFRIENHTARDCFIQVEFVDQNRIMIGPVDWYKNIDDITLAVTNEYQLSTERVLLPDQNKKIVSYYPVASLTTRSIAYAKMHNIPILEKLREIIKTLIITNDTGHVVFTLNDLHEETLRIDEWGNSVYYVLEIRE